MSQHLSLIDVYLSFVFTHSLIFIASALNYKGKTITSRPYKK